MMGSNQRAARRRAEREAAKRYEAQPQNLPPAPIMSFGYDFLPRHEGGKDWVECIHSLPNFQSRVMIEVGDIDKYCEDLQEAKQMARGESLEVPKSDSQLPSGLVIPSADISSKYG